MGEKIRKLDDKNEPKDGKLRGKIKNVVSNGYGFIETDKHIDYFFHHSQFKGDWKDLLKKFVCQEPIFVEFENDYKAPSGPRALNVRIYNADLES